VELKFSYIVTVIMRKMVWESKFRFFELDIKRLSNKKVRESNSEFVIWKWIWWGRVYRDPIL